MCMSMCVCVCVCVSVCPLIYLEKRKPNFNKFFVYRMLPGTVAQSSFVGFAIRYVPVLPVSWITRHDDVCPWRVGLYICTFCQIALRSFHFLLFLFSHDVA